MIKFTKMNALGNDFVIIDNREQNINFNRKLIKLIADRKFGIGCDQVLVLKDSTKADVFMEIYNTDGGTAGACGNGTRSVGKLLSQQLQKDKISIETEAGILYCDKITEESYRVNMGKPKFLAQDIPLSQNIEDALELPINIKVNDIEYKNPSAVSMGNPHCVFILDEEINLDELDIETIGRKIENHELFPEKTNVEFVQVLDKDTIKMRVWERGAGETLACGSGACAIGAVCVKKGLVNNKVTVKMKGGDLQIEWNGNASDSVLMTGDSDIVFSGEFYKK